ncbi:MAG: hypothetical protein A2017_08105 [Lentisphaerae bacterium GWF2_44_16]|nr:MAG: hypothetical protein A2017_08105 [Lentisphaerae bacterium GWF2_44_16]
MAYTIKDVARLAKVDPSTVSRILSNAAGFTYPEKTRSKVFAAAASIDYRPSEMATILRTKKSRMIGIAVQPNPSYAGYRMISMIFDSISELGYTPVITGYKKEEDGTFTMSNELGSFCGIVCLYQNLEEKTVALCKKQNLQMPIVLLARSITSSPLVWSVVSNTEKSILDAVRYLFDAGHREVALICFEAEKEDPKINAYAKAVKKLGLVKNLIFIQPVPEEDIYNAGQNAAKLLMKKKNITAALCASDEIAMGFIYGLSSLGKRVPEDFSVIGFDDLPFARYAFNGMSTIKQYFDKKAKVAAELVISLVETGKKHSKDNHEISLDCELVLRNTTAPSPLSLHKK